MIDDHHGLLIEPEDILEFNGDLIKAQRFKEVLNSHFQIREYDEGLPCSWLRLGSNQWVAGEVRVKLSIEFYPQVETEVSSERTSASQSPSPLDDIRQSFEQES